MVNSQINVVMIIELVLFTYSISLKGRDYLRLLGHATTHLGTATAVD